MSAIDDLRDGFPEAAKDTKLNVDVNELGEHFNKAKIIANENRDLEREEDESLTNMVQFNQLGK